jgi:hypothetical protein
VSASSGVPQVQPSTLVESTMSAPACGRARASSGAIGVPNQRALPTRSPPTSLETQARVMSRSTSGPRRRSSKPIDTSCPTIPWILRRQSAAVMRGVTSVVSMR